MGLYTHTHTHTHTIFTKKEKGITIISLVVTIIILLILAGVTISTVTGDNGLFSRAKDAVEESKKASYQEELTTIGLGIKLEKSSERISSKEYVDLFEEEMNRQIANETIFKDSKIRRKNDETLRVETKEGYVFYVREDETLYIGKAGEVDESEVPDITMGDINFKYSKEEWTNQDVTVEILIGENVENKDNYIIEYSKDAKNWTRYTAPIPMTANGEIYARAKDRFGDIKVEKYATGEVQNIDKNAPIAGTITMREEIIDGPIYLGGAETPRNLFIEMENGADNENESGYKSTIYNISGPITIESGSESKLLTKEGTYTITVITEDLAGNTSLPRNYTIKISKFDENGWAKDTVKIYEEDGTYWVPEGFKIAEDSGTTINEGIVVEDKNENQWVWIPCYVNGGVGENVANAIKYDRYEFTRNNPTWIYKQTKLTEKDSDGSFKIVREDDKSSYYHEALLATSAEYLSIKKYGGYYIGRYEVGDKDLSDLETPRLRTSSDGINHTAVIKKNQIPYNYVTTEQCKAIAESMISENGTDTNKLDGRKVFTKLCSSYSWDTATKFIEKSHQNYGINSKTKSDTLVDNTSENESNSTLANTGSRGSVCNIYDMGGNLGEYTTEKLTNDKGNYVDRGGNYNYSSSICPTGYRGGMNGRADELIGFRITLFIKS